MQMTNAKCKRKSKRLMVPRISKSSFQWCWWLIGSLQEKQEDEEQSFVFCICIFILYFVFIMQAKEEGEEQSFEVMVNPDLEPSDIADSILQLLKK